MVIKNSKPELTASAAGLATDDGPLKARITELELENVRLRMASRVAMIGTAAYNIQGDMMLWDDLCFEIYGLESSAIPSRELLASLTHPDDRDRLRSGMAEAMDIAGPGTYDLTIRVLRPGTHNIRTVRLSGKAIFDLGQPVQLCGTVSDVTDQFEARKAYKKLNDNLIRSERRRNAATRAGKVGIYDFDVASQTAHWDSQSVKIFGLGSEGCKIDYQTIEGVIHPDDLETHNATVGEIMDKPYPSDFQIVYRIRRADTGEERWIDATGRTEFQDGELVTMIGTIRDTTDQVTREMRERALKERLQIAIDAGGIGAWEWNVAQGGAIVDETFFKIFGTEPRPVISFEEYLGVIHPDDREEFSANFRTALTKPELKTRGTVYRAVHGVTGNIIWIKVRGHTEFKDGQPVRRLGTILDITDEVERREELEALTAKLIKNEDRYTRATHAAMVGTWDFDLVTEQADMDDVTRWLYRVPEGEVVTNRTPFERIHPDDLDNFNAGLDAAMNPKGNGEVLQSHRLRPDLADKQTWLEFRGQVEFEGAQPIRISGTSLDITAAHEAADRLDMMNRELHHRVKNLFSTLRGLIRMSAREHSEVEAYVESLTGRLQSLSAAHLISMNRDESAPVELRQIVDAILRPYMIAGESRIHISGGDFAIKREAVTNIGMILHELATNAVKYGALSAKGERLDVEIHAPGADDDDHMAVLIWRETVPVERDPAARGKQGFGSRLIESSARQLGSDYAPKWFDHGFEAVFKIPVCPDPKTDI